MKKILVVVNEPGSANALAPVLVQLKQRGFHLSVFASEFAYPSFRRVHLAAKPLDHGADPLVLMRENKYDLVLVGSSLEPSIERLLVRSAQTQAIPTMTVLDHWTNYWQRFTDPETNMRLDSLPDVIAVMDERAKREMIAQGIPQACIAVTGQPYLEQIALRSPALSKDLVRGRLGVPENGLLVTFVSEVRADRVAVSSEPPDFPDQDEIVTAANWTAQGLRSLHDQFPVLVLKSHPLEGPDLMRGTAQKLQHFVPTMVVSELDGQSLAAASSLVVGLTSMLLLESAYLGCPTLSIRPAGRDRDNFVGRHLGLVESTYARSETISAIRRIASGEYRIPKASTEAASHKGATAAVIRLIDAVLERQEYVPSRANSSEDAQLG